MNLVDPEGRTWKTDKDKNEANKIKKDSEKKLNKIQRDINKAQIKLDKKTSSKRIQSKLKILKQQEELITSFIDGIDKLTISPNIYTFIDLGRNDSTNPNIFYQNQDNENNENGYLGKNDIGEIEINYIRNYSNIYHETQHAIQYELGKLKITNFNNYDSSITPIMIRQFEVEAYQIEYIFNSNFNPTLRINSFSDINVKSMERLGY